MSPTERTTAPLSPAPAVPGTTRFLTTVKRAQSPETLKLHQQRLQFLAQNFDPFSGDPAGECAQIVALYELEATLSNPFEFTNALLLMLDAVEDALKR
jgi:hypothetical protein